MGGGADGTWFLAPVSVAARASGASVSLICPTHPKDANKVVASPKTQGKVSFIECSLARQGRKKTGERCPNRWPRRLRAGRLDLRRREGAGAEAGVASCAAGQRAEAADEVGARH